MPQSTEVLKNGSRLGTALWGCWLKTDIHVPIHIIQLAYNNFFCFLTTTRTGAEYIQKQMFSCNKRR